MSQTIIRSPRRHRFVIIDQHAVEDSRLSWAARGLLGYLLSRPDDWKVLVNDLRKRGDLGRDGIYTSAPGTPRCRLCAIRAHHVTGTAASVAAPTLFGKSQTSPHPELPDTVEPDTAEPCPVKPGSITYY